MALKNLKLDFYASEFGEKNNTVPFLIKSLCCSIKLVEVDISLHYCMKIKENAAKQIGDAL